MNKRGMEELFVKIIYLILFLLLVVIAFYFYKTKLKEGIFSF